MKNIHQTKECDGFPGYLIHRSGAVYSVKSKKFLKPRDNGSGYKQYRLYKDGKSYYPRVHRLVWENFMGKIPKGIQIDHIDYNKSNNHLLNLRAVTNNENQKTRRGWANSKTGIKGVYKLSNGKYRVRRTVEGIYEDRGVFNTIEEAKQRAI